MLDSDKKIFIAITLNFYIVVNKRLKYIFGPNFRQVFSNKSKFWFCVQIGSYFRQFCSIGSFFANTI